VIINKLFINRIIFLKEKKFQMYVKYCENKPKSEYIVSEYDTHFEELRIKLNLKLNIQDLLIKPVQRIMKYQLMLKEIKKYMEKQGMDCEVLDKAIAIMVTVPKNADDMMNVGRLTGFKGRITAQGSLLLQDTVSVFEADPNTKNSKQPKLKERRVFLFQQIIIFSEMIGSNKKFTSPKYIYKNDIQVKSFSLSIFYKL
jgi:Rho guanine nucleotide exchange factor 25